MKRLIAMPSIEQFRTIVANVNREYNFVGLDDTGEAIYDISKPKPTLTFKGTVKLHGTNAGVCYNDISGLWVQSKENIITPQSDNAGFAFFVESKRDIFISLIKELSTTHNINLSENTVTLYMEWVGKGIQKSVAISNMDKSAFIFSHAKVAPFNTEKVSYWIETKVNN
jgi:hypothetical protein